jgi:competence protein ComEA
VFADAELLRRLRTRRALAFGGGTLVCLGLAGWGASHQAAAAPPAPVADNVPAPAQAQTVLVFVSGAVGRPGLYQLSPDARIADAIAAAGGITSAADPGHLPDLASRVHDGRQVNVPFTKAGSVTAKLDINSASVDELSSLPGMPAGLAEAIVGYRNDWGGFATLSELRTVLGVDSATVTALGHYLKVVIAPR